MKAFVRRLEAEAGRAESPGEFALQRGTASRAARPPDSPRRRSGGSIPEARFRGGLVAEESAIPDLAERLLLARGRGGSWRAPKPRRR